MNKKSIYVLPLIVVVLFCCSFVAPKGWKISGNASDKYDIGLWKVGGQESPMCGMIRSTKKDYFNDEYGSLIQVLSSQKFLGKRVRLTASMKTRAVTAWAGFFLRADNEDADKPLTFDNMHDRPIKGTTDWTPYQIELDIPLNSSKIAFGAILHGTGQIWFDNFNIEEIGESTMSATYVKCDTSLKRMPENLDFEVK
jgi:hypothetical protein